MASVVPENKLEAADEAGPSQQTVSAVIVSQPKSQDDEPVRYNAPMVNYSQLPPGYEQTPQGYGYGAPPPPQQGVQHMHQASYQVSHQVSLSVPQTQAIKRMPQNVREWDAGLFGCVEDCGICLCGTCLPWCLVCSVASNMQENVCLACMDPFFMLCMMRNKMRTQYGIKGSICNDCCTVCWCAPCVSCQVARQVKTFRHSSVEEVKV